MAIYSKNYLYFSFCGLDDNSILIDRPIQNFAFSTLSLGNRVYTTQNVKSGSNAGNTYLGMYDLNTSNKTCTWLMNLTLNGYGHGETLEVTPKDSVSEYIWVGSNAETETGDYYSTAITRFVLNRVGQVYKSDEKTLKHFRYATKTGTSIEANNVQRVQMCINEEEDRIAFRIKFKNSGNVYFSVYKLSGVMDALNNSTGIVYMENLTSAFVFCVQANIESYFQSVDYLKNGTTHHLYQNSGNLSKGANLYIKRYAHTYSSSTASSITQLGSAKKTVQVISNHKEGYENKGEMEGLKVTSSYIYFGIVINVNGKRANTTDVFRIPKTSLD